MAAVSFFIFFQFDISFTAYIGIAVSILALFGICFRCHKSALFFFIYSSCAFVNLGVFLLSKYFDDYRICRDAQDYFFISYAVFLLLFWGISLVSILTKMNNDNNTESYFSERKYDLIRLYDFVNNFSVVGLDSFWGEGKTHLFKLLKEQHKEFFYISIYVMTVHVDTVEKYVISEINTILEQNGIISLASTKLLKFLKNDNLSGVGRLFIKNESYTKLFKDLSNDVQKLNKPILITYEDIDRIQSPDLIYKIFAISELLTSATSNIKILYQYDENILLKNLGEKKIYLEKYIPHTLSLTPINFRRCLKVLIKEGKAKNKYKGFKLDDFDFLFYEINLDYNLRNAFGVNKVFSLSVYFSIRKVQIFLDEIDELLNSGFEYQNNLRVLLTLIFIKNFNYNEFNDFSDEEPYSKTKLFIFNKAKYSIYEIIELFNKSTNKQELFDKIFKTDSKNLNHLIFLHFFCYEFKIIKTPIEQDEAYKERMIQLLNEEFDNIRIAEHNDKIDRLIRNLLYNGKSEYTNLENVVKEIEKILDKPTKEEIKTSFDEFCKSSFYEEFEKGDNSTVFRIGMSRFIPIFQGFRLYEKNEVYWIKLIDFYFEFKDTSISAEVIHVLNYCDIYKKNVFLHIIRKFNSLTIKGNLNDTICYPRFLIQYIGAFTTLGYIDTRLIDVYSFNFKNLEKNKENYKDLYFTFLDELRNLKTESPLQQIKDESDILKEFLKKNVRIILNKNFLKEYTGGVTSTSYIKDGLEDIFKELDEKHLSDNKLEKYLEEQYSNGSLSAYQVKRIYNKYKK